MYLRTARMNFKCAFLSLLRVLKQKRTKRRIPNNGKLLRSTSVNKTTGTAGSKDHISM